jgi:hypothetical protein
VAMSVITRSLHTKMIALLLASLVLSSVSVLAAAEATCLDDGMQICHEEASSVALVRHFFVLEVSMASMYLSHQPEEVLGQAPLVLRHTNRGPPIFS